MRTLSRCLFLVFLILFLLLIPQNTLAAPSIIINTIQVDLWPEYDRPDVLVIYRANLANAVALPARLTLRIPRSAGGPASVAMKDPSGMLYSLDHDTVVDGEWLKISFTTPVQDIQVEYYDPEMQMGGDQRSFVYRWPGDYQVNTMTLQIQKPLTASDLTTSPTLGIPHQGEDGLVYYSLIIGKLQVGQNLAIRVSYTKSDDQLSYSGGAVEPSEPILEAVRGRIVFKDVLPWLISAVVLLLAAGGVLWYHQDGHEFVDRQKRIKSKPRSLQRAGNHALPVYCHQCGKRAHSGDLFCRSCGSKLRIP